MRSVASISGEVVHGDRSEVMFHDVQFFPGAVHAPLDDLRKLPAGIKSKMFLMHYSDDFAHHGVSDFAGWAQQGMIYRF